MPEFMEFQTLDEMIEWMGQRTAEANAALAPEQATISYGDYWARFDHVEDVGLIFGQVMTLDEATAATPPSERDYEITSLTENHERGYMFGRCYSVVEPAGSLGDTHRANMWPITQGMFERARAAGWDQRNLDLEMKIALMNAHRAWYDHERTIAT